MAAKEDHQQSSPSWFKLVQTHLVRSQWLLNFWQPSLGLPEDSKTTDSTNSAAYESNMPFIYQSIVINYKYHDPIQLFIYILYLICWGIFEVQPGSDWTFENTLYIVMSYLLTVFQMISQNIHYTNKFLYKTSKIPVPWTGVKVVKSEREFDEIITVIINEVEYACYVSCI